MITFTGSLDAASRGMYGELDVVLRDVVVVSSIATGSLPGTRMTDQGYGNTQEVDVSRSEWERCGNSDCIAGLMRARGGSQTAIDYMRDMIGSGAITGYSNLSPVDVIEYSDPSRANHNESWALLWPNADMLDVNDWGFSRINLRDAPGYQVLASRFSDLQLWLSIGFLGTRNAPDGGTDYLFEFEVVDGCHACETGYAAEVAFRITAAAKFERARIVTFRPPVEAPSSVAAPALRNAVATADSIMAELYFTVRTGVPLDRRDALLAEQRAWLAQRARQCGAPLSDPVAAAPDSSLACLLQLISARSQELHRWLQ
jgi:hypothetical protein